jgi:hypothetical protein
VRGLAIALHLALLTPAAAQSPAPGATPSVAGSQSAYAGTLQRTFYSKGLSFEVSWAAKAEKGPFVSGEVPGFKRLYPRLVIFGSMNDAIVFWAITEENVLTDAKAAGFTSVRFFPQGGGAERWYDISGAGPWCDFSKRVCM